MKNCKYLLLLCMLAILAACDKQNKNLVTPLVGDDFPQILVLSDEGDGELEDEDKFSFKITLADREDPQGKELGGKVVPLSQDVTVHFEIDEFKGISSIASYIKSATAFYEIDDCTTKDINVTFDAATGKGTVVFPKGVEEIEIEFETDPDVIDDKKMNDKRSIGIKLTSVNANGHKVVVNTNNKFEYLMLDDEGIYGEYELDIEDADQFQKFKKLFGLVNEDISKLSADDVDKIEIAFEYGEFKAIVVLKEEERVEECGEVEMENKEIEIEAEFTSLYDDKLSGEVAMEGAVEEDNGTETEYTFSGGFSLNDDKLELTLTGEMEGAKTEKITLKLEK